MRLLVLSAYYEPEIVASMYLSKNLYEDIAKKEIDIQLYTPVPTRGVDKKVRDFYKKNKIETKCNGKLVIHRYLLYSEGKNIIGRAFRYLLLNVISLWKGLCSDADLIFVQSTPPTQGVIAVLIKKIKKIPFVYNLQDIFPDSLINTGISEKGTVIWKIGRIIENFTYKNTDKIIVISEDFKANLMNKGVAKEKISVIYNWVDETKVTPVDRINNVLFDRYHLNRNDFYITYCGNIGHTQNFEMLIKVADELRNYDDIKFTIFGDGAFKQELEKLIIINKLDNMIVLPFQPYEDISHVFSFGDAGLIISKAGIGNNSVPSKTWSIMAAERVVIASFDLNSELRQIIDVADCGICVEPDNKDALKSAILSIYKNKNTINEKGVNGRRYILDNLSREKATSKYIQEIVKIKLTKNPNEDFS